MSVNIDFMYIFINTLKINKMDTLVYGLISSYI